MRPTAAFDTAAVANVDMAPFSYVSARQRVRHPIDPIDERELPSTEEGTRSVDGIVAAVVKSREAPSAIVEGAWIFAAVRSNLRQSSRGVAWVVQNEVVAHVFELPIFHRSLLLMAGIVLLVLLGLAPFF